MELEDYTAKTIWLNPMPKTRWQGTSAEAIERLVPMYSLENRAELQYAIDKLRGK